MFPCYCFPGDGGGASRRAPGASSGRQPLIVVKGSVIVGFDVEKIARAVHSSDKGPPATHDSRLLCCLPRSSSPFNGWERDSPKGLYPIVIVLFVEPDCVSAHSLEGSQLCNDPSRNLSATLISHDQGTANQQLSIYLDGSSIPIQFGGFGGDRKGTFSAFLS